jgi:small subunit ribosomal protein S9
LTTTDTTEAPSEASVEVEDQAPSSASAPESVPASRPSKPITQTTGRRKRAVARVRLRPGNGKITVNRRSFEDYFTSATHRMIVSEPLRISNIAERYDIDVTMDGGGTSGQAGALRLGITRALVEIDPELRTSLKRAGLLTRDAREKESKKYGLKKARKAPQYSKR